MGVKGGAPVLLCTSLVDVVEEIRAVRSKQRRIHRWAGAILKMGKGFKCSETKISTNFASNKIPRHV